MKQSADIELKDLRNSVKALNASGLAGSGTIRIVGVKTDALINAFVTAVESVPDDQATELPDDVIDYYNFLVDAEDPSPQEEDYSQEDDEESAPDDDEKPGCFEKAWDEKAEECQQCFEGYPEDYEACKAAVQKVAVAKVAKKKAPKKRESALSDEFGFREGTKSSYFAKQIKDSGKVGITMSEAKKADWNTSNSTFYDLFHKMCEKGQAMRIGGRLFISEQFGGPNAQEARRIENGLTAKKTKKKTKKKADKKKDKGTQE